MNILVLVSCKLLHDLVLEASKAISMLSRERNYPLKSTIQL